MARTEGVAGPALDHCEAETSLGDRCRKPVSFIMRCRNSGFRYDVCGTHRKTGEAHGDTVIGRLHQCAACSGTGWILDRETVHA